MRFIETTTSQCQQLKLNPLSMQINIYCVITNQTLHSPLMRAPVILRHSLYFSCLPPPTTLKPNACLLGTYETKMVVLTGKCLILTILRKNTSSETQGQSVEPGEKARRKFSSTGGRAPGYRLSPDHFQTVK